MNNPTRLAFCTPSLYIPGGVERVLTTHVNWLVEHTSYEVYIILTDGKDKAPYYALDPRVKVIQLDVDFEVLWSLGILRRGLVYLKKQREYKRKLSCSLMELHPDITVSLMRREVNFITDIKDGSRKLGWLHVTRGHYRNFEANDTNFFKRLLEKVWMAQLIRNVKKLDKLVVLTQEDADAWVEVPHVAVMPNPLPQVYTKRSDLESKRVMACGRYVYSKGYDMLIAAWAIVHKKHPDWFLSVYGEGERDAFQQQVNALGLQDAIQLHGATTDIESCYAASSILAMSSRFEGFGMVLIEAMNCGVPCVSFACPCGPRSIIEDGKTGFLAKAENVEDLALQLCRLMEDAGLRKQMGERAYLRSLDYIADNVLRRWVALYEEMMGFKPNGINR